MRNMAVVGMLIAALVLAGTAMGEVSREGLVAELLFDGDVNDSSENGNNGTIYGATFVDDISGKALSFDGVNDYVKIPDSASLDITNMITIDVWVKGNPAQPSGKWGRIVDHGHYVNKEGYDLVRSPDSNTVVFNFWATDGIQYGLGSATKINDNIWHHIVAIYDGNTMKIYVDNVLENQKRIGQKTIKTTSNILGIGGNFDGNVWHYFNGLIDDIHIYNRSLSGEEIKTLYEVPNDKQISTNSEISTTFFRSIEKKEINWMIIGGGVILILIGITVSKYYRKIQSKNSGPSERTPPNEPDMANQPKENIGIRRGYEILPDNNVRFGVRIINNSDSAISDVEVILDYTNTLFELQGHKARKLGTIPPTVMRTAEFIMKPIGCIHKENVSATIIYKDYQWKKHILDMRPKEMHCIIPFLREKPMTEAEYTHLAADSDFVPEGISFKGIGVEDLAKFMEEKCRHMLYKVREYDISGKKVIYLSGESIGEKAYYLLTVVVQDYKGLTQVFLKAHSDKKYGLNGFMNEMADSLRHLVGSVQNAKEIGIIENTQVINIIDSVVQRTTFNMGEGGSVQAHIKESVVQRSNIGASARKCPNCGREVEANEKFCLECGANLKI